jgi:hypothetical protein
VPDQNLTWLASPIVANTIRRAGVPGSRFRISPLGETGPCCIKKRANSLKYQENLGWPGGRLFLCRSAIF